MRSPDQISCSDIARSTSSRLQSSVPGSQKSCTFLLPRPNAAPYRCPAPWPGSRVSAPTKLSPAPTALSIVDWRRSNCHRLIAAVISDGAPFTERQGDDLAFTPKTIKLFCERNEPLVVEGRIARQGTQLACIRLDQEDRFLQGRGEGFSLMYPGSICVPCSPVRGGRCAHRRRPACRARDFRWPRGNRHRRATSRHDQGSDWHSAASSSGPGMTKRYCSRVNRSNTVKLCRVAPSI